MSGWAGRPDHPDFELLSKIVLELDDSPSGIEDFAAYLRGMIDPASITYMANGRAQMALRTLGEPPTREWLAAFGAMYIDGFLLGHEYTKRKAASRVADMLRRMGEDQEGEQ